MPYTPTVKRHYKYKNIAACLAVCLLLILALTSSCSNKALSRAKAAPQTKTVNSSAVKKESKDDEKKITENYRYEKLDNKLISSGDLVLVNSDHKFEGTVGETDTLYQYLFNDNGMQVMYASTTVLEADKMALEAINGLVSEYYASTSDGTVMIYSTMDTPDGSAPEFDECATGLTFDLLTYDQATGSYPTFTGEGTYSWITANAWKYGLVLRYPADKTDKTGNAFVSNHFRYLGVPHTEIMSQNGLCLEEYLEFIKDYSFEKPYSVLSEDGNSYSVYYVKQGKDRTTKVPVPQDASGNDYSYEISGNNYDGFVVAVNLTAENNVTQQAEPVPQDDASSQTEEGETEQ